MKGTICSYMNSCDVMKTFSPDDLYRHSFQWEQQTFCTCTWVKLIPKTNKKYIRGFRFSHVFALTLCKVLWQLASLLSTRQFMLINDVYAIQNIDFMWTKLKYNAFFHLGKIYGAFNIPVFTIQMLLYYFLNSNRDKRVYDQII